MVRKLLAEVAGVVEAPIGRVREAIAAGMLPEHARSTGHHRVEDFPGHTSTVEVSDRLIAFQGGWWYRGEWSLAPHPQGTLITHRVYNVAEVGRWGVAPANRFFIGFREKTRNGFSSGITGIADRLGCAARLV
jgi:hypothetical protein